jgi:ribonuclease P/MRP protein subunit POP5
MVRVKHRYLVVNILYPELENVKDRTKVPDIVTFNQPTTDALDTRALLKGLRDSVASLFGDYGSGAISTSLSGNHSLPS